MQIDQQELKTWIGRTEQVEDWVTPGPAAALAATLDRGDPSPAVGDPLPPAWHWLYALDRPRMSRLGEDGHAARGGFLPPVPLPRRMWAGGRMAFHRPLRIGQRFMRQSEVADVRSKTGRSGDLVFVMVRHRIWGDSELATTEEHDIVYRSAPMPGVAAASTVPKAPSGALWRRPISPDPVLLFRFSALTFNGHRIHYDRPYAQNVEGYPGLIVHGPLVAILLLDLVRRERPAATVQDFDYRAVSPLFDIAPFVVAGRSEDAETSRLWAENMSGDLAMTATIRAQDDSRGGTAGLR